MEADRFFAVLSHPEPWVVLPVVAAVHAFVARAADGGVGGIVDGLLPMRDWLKDAIDQLADRRAFLVGVRCPLEELERREAARGNRRRGNAREQLAFVHAHGVFDFEVDTSRASPTEPETRRLVGEAAEIKARHRTAIEPMLDEGHVWQAAWPLLWAAILDAPRDGSRAVVARGHILRALRLDTEEEVGARLAATEEWLGALRDAAEERVRAQELVTVHFEWRASGRFRWGSSASR